MTNTSNSKRSSPKGWLPTSLRGLFTLFMCWVFMVSSTFAATEQVTYIHTDISGSPIAATDAAGTILWRESYRGYGERWLNQPAGYEQNQWFHGKELDATGMQYFGARYYDPEVGRFTGIDPVGFQEGNLHSFNRFSYGNNNPVKYSDPDGQNGVLYLGLLVLASLVVFSAATVQSNNNRNGGIPVDSFWGRNQSTISPASNSPTNNIVNSAPPIPTGIVGDQSDPRSGLNDSGKKHTSGGLLPQHGGNGDFWHDLGVLGGKLRPVEPSDRRPPGSWMGENGIFGRPGNSTGGATIDIPANGKKPAEALHYPPSNDVPPNHGWSPNSGPQRP